MPFFHQTLLQFRWSTLQYRCRWCTLLTSYLIGFRSGEFDGNINNGWEEIGMFWDKNCNVSHIMSFFAHKTPSVSTGSSISKNYVFQVQLNFYISESRQYILLKLKRFAQNNKNVWDKRYSSTKSSSLWRKQNIWAQTWHLGLFPWH